MGRTAVYTVDGLGRTTALHQNGRSEQWSFRTDGALATYTDSGRVTGFAYDNDQLLTGIDYPEGMADVSYGYDAAGNLTSMSDGLGSTSYDVLNRLDTRTRNNRTVDYGYSATNQVTSIDYWGQGTVGYGYDNVGRLDHLTPWGERQRRIAIAAVGCWPVSAAPTVWQQRIAMTPPVGSRG